MKQIPAEKYNVAWFTLADCIARGEKERALGVYRLLAHSFDDPALARQLQGDILLAFHDERAPQVYQEAAQLYLKRGRFIEAAAMYEHLIMLTPENHMLWQTVIELYQQLRIPSKVTAYLMQAIDLLMGQNQWDTAIELATQYEAAGDLSFTAQLYEKMLFHLICKNVLLDRAVTYARKALALWKELENEQALKRLLTKLKEVDERLLLLFSEIE